MPVPEVYMTARKITPPALVTRGSGVGIACSVAGNVGLVMDDGSIYVVYATVGQTQIDGLAVRGVETASTTATAIVTVLG